MKLAIELLAIWTAANIAFALQRIYLAQRREQREQISFAGSQHPPGGTAASYAPQPPSVGREAADNFQSALASATRADSAAAGLNLADPSVPVAADFSRRFS